MILLKVCRTLDSSRMKLNYKHFFLPKMPDQRPQTKLFGAVSSLGVSLLYQTTPNPYIKGDEGKPSSDHPKTTGIDRSKDAPGNSESLDNKVNLLFLRLPLLSCKRGRFFLSSGVERSREYSYLYSFEMGHFMIAFQRSLDNEGRGTWGTSQIQTGINRLQSVVSQVRKSDF